MLCKRNGGTEMNPIYLCSRSINETQIDKALQCLIDNGIDQDEACVILQALGYILLDEELFPEEVR
jgi:hypothetical protein